MDLNSSLDLQSAEAARLFSLEKFAKFYPNQKVIGLLRQYDIHNVVGILSFTDTQLAQILLLNPLQAKELLQNV
jgi:hypothetical protein